MHRQICFIALLTIAPLARAQVIDWNTTAGNWSVPGNWLPVNIPNASGESAVIGNADAIVTLNISVSIDAAMVGVEGARLNLPGQTLTTSMGLSNFGLIVSTGGTNTINGPVANYSGAPDGMAVNAGTVLVLNCMSINNDGRIEINPTNAGVATTLRLDADTALDGTGELLLTGEATRASLNTNAGVTLTQGANHSIRGQGNLNAALVNDGTVDADVPGGTLTLTTGAKTNNNIMKATGGTLSLSSFTLTQSEFGLLIADTAGVNLSSMTILGGVLSTENDGLIRITGGSNTLESITNTGALDSSGGTTTRITGSGIANAGVFRINPANSGVGTTLRFEASGNLSGTGELVLGGPGSRATLSSLTGVTVTQDSSHTIRGEGQITAPLINDGVVHSNVAGGTMSMLTNDKANNGIIMATDGSTLALSGFTLTQSPFGLLRAEAAEVHLSGMTVLGGVLETLDSGLIRITGGTNTLDAVTNFGAIDTTGGTTTVITGKGIANVGVIRINPANAGIATTIRFDASGNLSSTGELVLGGPGSRATLSALAGVTITQDSSHTIRGEGQIIAPLINDGFIRCDVAGGTMSLNTNAKTNNSIITAINGSTLALSTFTLNQGTFGVVQADDATVELTTVTIVGGTIESFNGGLFRLSGGTNTLNSIYSNAAIDQSAGTTTIVNGTGMTNYGLFRVNPANTALGTALRFDVTAPLTGAGELVLGGLGSRAILSALAGVTITQAPGHTISGIGQITATLINQGTIAPGLSAGALAIGGNTTQASGSVLDIELAGTASHDQLVGAGTINLGGTLRVTLIDGHVPTGAETYAIITTTNHPGRFASFDLPALSPPLEWRVEYLTAAIRLSVSPFCFGDATFDESVNFADVTAVLSNFGANYSPAPGTGPGDSNRDGIVNFADVTNTLTNFNVTCP